jgi:hypothetical protein
MAPSGILSPAGLTADLAPGGIELRWKPVLSRPPSRAISRYHVFRGPSPTGAVLEVGTVDASDAPTFLDTDLRAGASVVYLVTAETVDGVQGPAAGPVPAIAPHPAVAVTFEVSVPPETPPVYLAGDYFNDWDPAFLQMQPIDIGRWRHLQRFPVGILIAYKYTLGSWDTVEVSAAGDDLPNRTLLIPTRDVLVDDTVARWRAVAR